MSARPNVIPFPGAAARAAAAAADPQPRPPGPPLAGGPTWSDVGLLASLLAVSLVPLVGLAAATLQFGPAELGLGAAGAFFCGRELVAELRELRRRA